MRKVLTVVTVMIITIHLTAVIPQKAHLNAAKVKPVEGCPELNTNTVYYLNCADNKNYNLDLSKDQIERYLQLWKPNTSFAQRFYLVKADHNSYYIVKAQQDLNLHIIPDLADKTNYLRIGGELSGNTDLWKIIPVSHEAYYIVSECNGKALTSNINADPKDQITAKEYTGSLNQEWRFIPVN